MSDAIVNCDIRVKGMWDEDVFDNEDVSPKELAEIVINSEGFIGICDVGVGCIENGTVSITSVEEDPDES